MDKRHSVDIDDEIDFKLAEVLLEQKSSREMAAFADYTPLRGQYRSSQSEGVTENTGA
jgi:hypothetical protein